MRPTRQAGFTLLELLVVVALIGVMLTAVVMSVGDGGREKNMENEAKRLVAVIKLARDEAVLLSQELSMVIDVTHYDFQRYDKKKWLALQDERILIRHELQQGLELELEMESFIFTPKRKKSSSKDNDEEEDDESAVRVYFLSSGEVQPFILYIREQDNPDSIRFKVMADQEGEISWEGPLQAEDI